MPAFGCAVVYLKFPSSPVAPGAFAVGRSDLVRRSAVQADAPVRGIWGGPGWATSLVRWTQWYMFQLKELSETPNTPGAVTACRPGKGDFVLSLV